MSDVPANQCQHEFEVGGDVYCSNACNVYISRMNTCAIMSALMRGDAVRVRLCNDESEIEEILVFKWRE